MSGLIKLTNDIVEFAIETGIDAGCEAVEEAAMLDKRFKRLKEKTAKRISEITRNIKRARANEKR